jgi:hypothetical protein
LARAAKTRQPVQVADLRASRAYLEGDPLPVAAVDVAVSFSQPLFTAGFSTERHRYQQARER